jgi:hypothetical protein
MNNEIVLVDEELVQINGADGSWMSIVVSIVASAVESVLTPPSVPMPGNSQWTFSPVVTGGFGFY